LGSVAMRFGIVWVTILVF